MNTTFTPTSMDNLVTKIIDFENGEMTSEEEAIDFFQFLVNTGLAWKFQGTYGRTARDLLAAGIIESPFQTVGEC